MRRTGSLRWYVFQLEEAEVGSFAPAAVFLLREDDIRRARAPTILGQFGTVVIADRTADHIAADTAADIVLDIAADIPIPGLQTRDLVAADPSGADDPRLAVHLDGRVAVVVDRSLNHPSVVPAPFV